jgi:hypothetical protein
VNEIVPLLSGAVLGYMVGAPGRSKRYAAISLFAVPLGALASAVTGELSSSWEFVLIDIPLVALSATVAFAARLEATRARTMRKILAKIKWPAPR